MNDLGLYGKYCEDNLEKVFPKKQTDFYDKYGTGLPPISFFNLTKQNKEVKKSILDRISKVIDESDFINGESISEFENNFSNWLRARSFSYSSNNLYTIGTSSGTSSLILALKCFDIGQGDEVIIPNNGYVSNASSIISVGATPVFCDIDPLTHMLDEEQVKLKMTTKTKAIIVIHMYGNVCDVIKFKKFGIPVIEDCAQAHGAQYDNHSVGAWTDNQIGCFSFYPSKTLGAMGDAGAVITTSKKYYTKMKSISNLGQITKNDFTEFPMNLRLNAFQSIVLDEKLKHLDKYIEARIDIMKIYDEKLPYDAFHQPKTFNRSGCVPYVYVIAPQTREKYIEAMKENNIGFSFHYSYRLNSLKPFRDYYQPLYYMPSDLKWSEKMRNRVISLPFFPEMQIDDVYKICDVLNETIHKNESFNHQYDFFNKYKDTIK